MRGHKDVIGLAAMLCLPLAAGCSHGEKKKVEKPVGVTRFGCPPMGAAIPFAALLASAQQLAMCDLVTEVSLVGEGSEGLTLLISPPKGQLVYRVLPPGAAPTLGPNGLAVVNYITLPHRHLKTMRDVRPGAYLRLRGFMDYRTYLGADQGTFSRSFRAHTVEVISAPTIVMPPAAGQAPAATPAPALAQ